MQTNALTNSNPPGYFTRTQLMLINHLMMDMTHKLGANPVEKFCVGLSVLLIRRNIMVLILAGNTERGAQGKEPSQLFDLFKAFH